MKKLLCALALFCCIVTATGQQNPSPEAPAKPGKERKTSSAAVWIGLATVMLVVLVAARATQKKMSEPSRMPVFMLTDIKKIIDQLAVLIQAPADLLPTYGYSIDAGHPHIESDNFGRLHYVVIERGQELQHRITTDPDELLYWVFATVTFSMASDYEPNNRLQKDSIQKTGRIIGHPQHGVAKKAA